MFRIKVNTEKYDNDIRYEVNKFLFDLKNGSYYTHPDFFQQVKLEMLDNVRKNSNKSVIVFIGNSKLILSHLNILKPNVVRYIQ